jgi:ferritin-like metal-binding protein YciE
MEEAREIYGGEKQLARQFPRMLKAVRHEGLRRKLEERMQQGALLMQELEQSFQELGGQARPKKNDVIDGFLSDINEHMQEIQHPGMKDAIMLGAIQMVEHYCIAAWGTTAAYARLLNRPRYVQAMERALAEGKRYDDEMTQLAEREVNPTMMEPMPEGEGRRAGAKKSASKRSTPKKATAKKTTAKKTTAKKTTAKKTTAAKKTAKKSSGKKSSSKR